MGKVEELHARLSEKLAEMEEIVSEYGYEVTPTLLLRHDRGPSHSMLISNDDLNKVVLCIAELGGIGEVVQDEPEQRPMNRYEKWLSVLTDKQHQLRQQKRYDQLDLTDQQKEALGEEGCCWIESPTFYAESKWCM